MTPTAKGRAVLDATTENHVLHVGATSSLQAEVAARAVFECRMIVERNAPSAAVDLQLYNVQTGLWRLSERFTQQRRKKVLARPKPRGRKAPR